MKAFSANYSYSNHNFVIQNLVNNCISNEYLPAVCIVKNILQRGKPTLMSSFLQEKLGSIHKHEGFSRPYPLIEKDCPIWQRIIRGNEKGNHFPAQKFYEKLLPRYLNDLAFVQKLIVPEIKINDITQVQIDDHEGDQVDFFLPQAYLIIEIDGKQHLHEPQFSKDLRRDEHTRKFGIKTVRIQVSDLEEENERFIQKIDLIRNRITAAEEGQAHRQKYETQTCITLKDYKKAYEDSVLFSNPHLQATAVIRFQVLLLELLENGQLSFTNSWSFEIFSRDFRQALSPLHEIGLGNNFAESLFDLGIQDLLDWFENIFQLQKIPFSRPSVNINEVDSFADFSNDTNAIKIDFSILKRFTDEFDLHRSIIFVRTHYLDEYRYFKRAHALAPQFSHFEPYDFFRISSDEPYNYRLKFGGKHSDEGPLKYLIWNIFLQNDPSLSFETLQFREGQLPIIANALSRNDTIGLLPTGSGKSVCYQLSAILQPGISFVVCPIKALMYDQKTDLEAAFFSRVNHITSDNDGETKEKIQQEFGKGKYFFILISPERFQTKTFRQYLSQVNENFNIVYAVIDEVHCLSEWGHDFRTSYLNLSSTIQNHCSDFNFLGLTATASINVLKDIQIEFGIKQHDVKTPVDYTRKELEFIVIDDENQKQQVIQDQLNLLREESGALQNLGDDSKCGIIFTPTVNGRNGCYPLSLLLADHFNEEIKFFSGSIPEIEGSPIMTRKEFDQYKKNVQSDFKLNNFSLLTATKAFGMGVNKGNIHYTFHYGIPGSMESLYQEAGRAGRDRTKFKNSKAKCFILLTKPNNPENLPQVWERATTLKSLNSIRNTINGDINTNLFLFSMGLDGIIDEFRLIKEIIGGLELPFRGEVTIRGRELDSNNGFNSQAKARTEKAIYRLKQLGIITDWTIQDFFNGGVFEVEYSNYTDISVQNALENTVRLHDKDFSFKQGEHSTRYKNIINLTLADSRNKTIGNISILLLLQWAYEHFAYNRRQSLKNIFELCSSFENTTAGKRKFKQSLEAYFKFSQSSYVIQHIAENSSDFEKWFEVFYQVEDNVLSDKFITRRQQESLRDNLSRFLESYMYNTGLDIISGLLRLLLDDYHNSDGRPRFESGLEKVKQYHNNDVEFILTQLIKIGHQMNNTNKSFLSESIYKHFNNKDILFWLASELKDSFSMTFIIEQANNKLLMINTKLYDGLKKIG
jgi:ATP-dependent DNA helicase RecQ